MTIGMYPALYKRLFNIGLDMVGVLTLIIGCIFTAKAIYFTLNPELLDNVVPISGSAILDAIIGALICLILGILLTYSRSYRQGIILSNKLPSRERVSIDTGTDNPSV
jgi:hypothetical protein